MKLYGSPTSPYVRKARVLISEKKLPVEFINEDPWPADSKIPSRNPLGKVPALEIVQRVHGAILVFPFWIDDQCRVMTVIEVPARTGSAPVEVERNVVPQPMNFWWNRIEVEGNGSDPL
ncbi:MAG: glutathione S-transferase N-terminal domain-containing protein, partial [Burkholderiales bacterium]